MVHVTFNEKVECHQYSSAQTEMQPNKSNDDENVETAPVVPKSGQQQPPLKYTAEFLKGLRYSPHTQLCPDALINSPVRKLATDPFWSKPNKNILPRAPYSQNYRGQRRGFNPFVPSYNYNQMNHGAMYRDGGFNRNGGSEPLEPIGSRYTAHYKNYMAENPDNFGYDRNVMSDFTRRHNPTSSSDGKNFNGEEQDREQPEWFTKGPTSQNDCVELHGFEGPGVQDQHDIADCNVSGAPTSGINSNNNSPPAKSTPAKVTFNDFQRTKRPDVGRTGWPNNVDNRQVGYLLSEIFKNYTAPQNQSNLRGLTPIVSVQDLESSLLYDRLKFRQMVAQMQQTQNLMYRQLYPLHEPIPTATQILSEADKILRTSNDPVFKRPEVHELIQNIIKSVIPPVNLMNLLKNPLTEPQSRETIQAALKVITQAKQNATKAMKTHTPTESELRAHMDAIMQDAIIKRRMENLNNELMKAHYQQGGRNFPNQSFHQFRLNDAGRFEGHSQSDKRGQCQSFENGSAQDINRWFSPNLLKKRQFPQMPSEHLRSEELENKFKQTLIGNEKEAK